MLREEVGSQEGRQQKEVTPWRTTKGWGWGPGQYCRHQKGLRKSHSDSEWELLPRMTLTSRGTAADTARSGACSSDRA